MHFLIMQVNFFFFKEIMQVNLWQQFMSTQVNLKYYAYLKSMQVNLEQHLMC